LVNDGDPRDISIKQFVQNRDIQCTPYLEQHLIDFNFEPVRSYEILRVAYKVNDTTIYFNTANSFVLQEVFEPLL